MIEIVKEKRNTFCKHAVEAFYQDTLYTAVFSSERTRKNIMNCFFTMYVKAMLPYAKLYTLQDPETCGMFVYDSRLWSCTRYCISMVILNFKMLRLIPKFDSIAAFFHAVGCYGMFTSAWVKEFEMKEYFHLDLLYTNPNSRQKGYGSALVHDLIALANHEKMDITLETHELENVSFYEKLGFCLVKTITSTTDEISQYCMLKRYRED